MQNIRNGAFNAMTELIESSELRAGDIVILGCSTSEITGGVIGRASNYEAGEAVVDGVLKAIEPHGLYLAVGCCEHLNRAVVIEREAAVKYGLEIVSAVPAVKAGGSAGTAAYKRFKEPVLVEFVKAHAGIDIGNTLIGMHLKHVAVPIRLSVKKIGNAPVTYAKTRPKYIGGSRTCY